MELKSPSIPLFPPGQRPKGETLMSLPFAAGQRGPLARRVMGGAAPEPDYGAGRWGGI
jgi:hypothetical protein